MSDVVWQALIAGVVTVIIAWMQHRTKVSVDEGNKATAKVASVAKVARDEQTDKLTSLGVKTDKIMAHTNSVLTAALRIIATDKKTIYNHDPTPENQNALMLAEKTLREHEIEDDRVAQEMARKKFN